MLGLRRITAILGISACVLSGTARLGYADLPAAPLSIGALGDSGTAGVLAGMERAKLWSPLYHLKIGLHFIPMIWRGGNVKSLTFENLSWATGLDRSGRVHSLAWRLRERVPELKVFNAAMPSVKTPELYARELPVLHAWSVRELNQNWPDIVTLFIGANDICADSLAEMTTVRAYARTMDKILSDILLHSPRTRVVLLPLPRFETFYENNKDARALGTMGGPWIGKCGGMWRTAPMCKTLTHLLPNDLSARRTIVERIADFNRILADLSAEWGDRVLYVSEMADLELRPEFLSIDCFHPNYTLHGRVAEMVWRKLAPRLR